MARSGKNVSLSRIIVVSAVQVKEKTLQETEKSMTLYSRVAEMTGVLKFGLSLPALSKLLTVNDI